MSNHPPAKRFRMIAGPNGSGKSTLKDLLTRKMPTTFSPRCGTPGAASRRFQSTPDPSRLMPQNHHTQPKSKKLFESRAISVARECIIFNPAAVNSYTIALVTNFLQDRHIAEGVSFSQETVFSHPSKIDALIKAHSAGFRTYFYFVSTDSPEINVKRVGNRALQGGHDVPAAKIEERYVRALSLARQVLPHADRAYFFDNSTDSMQFLAQWNLDSGMTFHSIVFPNWFLPFLSECHNPIS